MKQQNKKRLLTLAISAALAVGMGGTAFAQDNSDGGMPEVQHQGDVSFVSGGVGWTSHMLCAGNSTTGPWHCASRARAATIWRTCT